MPGFKITYCSKCGGVTAHDIYLSERNYLHSLCTDCGKDVATDAKLGSQNGEGKKICTNCNEITEHIRYISEKGYIHWFCTSCGKDVASDSQGN